jgi:hypothetical protein
MAGIEDCSQSHTRLQWHYHDSVHLVVHNMSNLSEIDRIDNLVVAIFFVTIKILGLAAVT